MSLGIILLEGGYFVDILFLLFIILRVILLFIIFSKFYLDN